MGTRLQREFMEIKAFTKYIPHSMQHKHFPEEELFAHALNITDPVYKWEGVNDALRWHSALVF